MIWMASSQTTTSNLKVIVVTAAPGGSSTFESSESLVKVDSCFICLISISAFASLRLRFFENPLVRSIGEH